MRIITIPVFYISLFPSLLTRTENYNQNSLLALSNFLKEQLYIIKGFVGWFLICKNRKVYYSLKFMYCKTESQTWSGCIALTYLLSCNLFQALNM